MPRRTRRNIEGSWRGFVDGAKSFLKKTGVLSKAAQYLTPAATAMNPMLGRALCAAGNFAQ